MISKNTLVKTAITYWSDEDECFVTESPLFPRTAGVGETAHQAREHFGEMIDEAYEELRAGKVAGYNKAGRPAKGNIDFHAQISPSAKEKISELAHLLGISQGDAIDYLVFFQEVKSKEENSKYEMVSNLKSTDYKNIALAIYKLFMDKKEANNEQIGIKNYGTFTMYSMGAQVPLCSPTGTIFTQVGPQSTSARQPIEIIDLESENSSLHLLPPYKQSKRELLAK